MGIIPTTDVPATDDVITDSVHQENVQAVTMEIGKVKGLAAPKVQDSFIKYTRTEQRSWRDAPRNPARSKGRRTMGRAGGR